MQEWPTRGRLRTLSPLISLYDKNWTENPLGEVKVCLHSPELSLPFLTRCLIYFLLGINHLINILFMWLVVGLAHMKVWCVHAEARGQPHLLFLGFRLPFLQHACPKG